MKDAASSLKAAQIEYNASVRDDAFRASLDSIQETVNLLLNDERMSKEKASSRALVALGPHYLDTWNDAHYFVDQAVAFASRTDGAEQEAQKLTQLSKDLYASKDRNEQRTLASLKCSVKSYRDSLSNAQGVDILTHISDLNLSN